jgi:hypothetical protein
MFIHWMLMYMTFNFLLDTNIWELLQIYILNFCGPFRRGMRNLKIHNQIKNQMKYHLKYFWKLYIKKILSKYVSKVFLIKNFKEHKHNYFFESFWLENDNEHQNSFFFWISLKFQSLYNLVNVITIFVNENIFWVFFIKKNWWVQ